MFDAATMTLGLRLRHKLGRGLIERWFVGYMAGEFGLDEATVRRLLETLFELYNRHDPRDVAMTDGGFDGVARLQDCDASRLLAQFGYDSGAPVSQEQLQAFRTFHDRDRFSSSQK